MRIIGPNCLGLINTPEKLNASFAAGMPEKGDIAFMSQSGAFGTAILDWAIGEQIGFSKFISVGNKADVDETTLLEAVGADHDTRVMLGYIESVQRGEEFMRAAREITRRKPVILFKSGMSAAGAKAASSHTGALAGSDNAYAAAFRQSGVLRAREVVDLFDWGLAFSYQKGIGGPNVALVTNAGGPGIIATDAVERSRLQMAALAKETVDALHKALPPAANFYNPIDVLGDARAERYDVAVRAALSDPNVHGVVVILTPQTSTEPLPTAEVDGEGRRRVRQAGRRQLHGRAARGRGLPLSHGAPRADLSVPRTRRGRDGRAVSAPAVDGHAGRAKSAAFPVAKDKVAAIFQQSRAAGRLELGEQEAREVISAYGFKVPRSVLATTHEEAVAAAREVGLPVVMKISSPDILHKSDVGGVRVGVATELEVVGAFTAIIESARRKLPQADISGVLVQEMIRGGRETILGMTRDAQFGPMIMFGLGGIYVEVLKDVSFRIAPLTRRDAEEMVGEIRSVKLLRGVRGQPPADFEALVEGLLRLSQLVMDFPEIVEMDLNPLAVFPKGGGTVAMDARLALKG